MKTLIDIRGIRDIRGTDAARYPVTPRTLPADDLWLDYVAEIALPAAEGRGQLGMVELYRRILADAGREEAQP